MKKSFAFGSLFNQSSKITSIDLANKQIQISGINEGIGSSDPQNRQRLTFGGEPELILQMLMSFPCCETIQGQRDEAIVYFSVLVQAQQAAQAQANIPENQEGDVSAQSSASSCK